LNLTLIQPASKWMHWATLWCHSDLFWAAISASSRVIPILSKSLFSRVIPILSKSLLTVLLQFWFVRGRPRPLLNPGTSQCNACRAMRWWSNRIRCPSHWSLLSPSTSSILSCPVLTLTSSFVTLYWAAYNLIFTFRTIHLFFHIFLIFPNQIRLIRLISTSTNMKQHDASW